QRDERLALRMFPAHPRRLRGPSAPVLPLLRRPLHLRGRPVAHAPSGGARRDPPLAAPASGQAPPADRSQAHAARVRSRAQDRITAQRPAPRLPLLPAQLSSQTIVTKKQSTSKNT